MPGHCRAALEAYPEWGAAGTLDVTNPAVVKALQTILDEVMDLFPGTVIHTGGDEVKYSTWKTAPSIQAAMKQKGFKSAGPLQKEFTNLMAKYVAGKGRRMMYWNGSVDQLPDEKSTIVQLWLGSESMISDIVSQGHDLINSGSQATYLDYNYVVLPLKMAYSFDPIPSSLDAKWHSKILGMGCQAWGEYTPTRQRVEYQVFPRLAAYAEVGWTAKELKNYDSFLQRLQAQKQRWDLAGIQYAKHREMPSGELCEEVTSRGTKVGKWTSKQLRKGSRYAIPPENDHEWDLAGLVKGHGRCLVTFVATGGGDRLHVRQVQLLENGIPVAADPAGMSGVEYGVKSGSYVFDVTPPKFQVGAKYSLRTNYNVLKGADTDGDIIFLNP
jgi:hexosaminidase